MSEKPIKFISEKTVNEANWFLAECWKNKHEVINVSISSATSILFGSGGAEHIIMVVYKIKPYKIKVKR